MQQILFFFVVDSNERCAGQFRVFFSMASASNMRANRSSFFARMILLNVASYLHILQRSDRCPAAVPFTDAAAGYVVLSLMHQPVWPT